jgi:hypothetical protein
MTTSTDPSSSSSNKRTSLTNIPYHISEIDNMYVCNICNFTYDSLRSIKAHLWKHSGHHSLSYPINDYNNNNNTPSITTNNNENSLFEKKYYYVRRFKFLIFFIFFD